MTKKKTDGVFSGAHEAFSNEYPILLDAILTYQEFDFSGLVREAVHHVRSDGLIVACGNARCHEGGYDLRSDIELMMSRDPMRLKAVCRQCEGWETKPQSKRSIGEVCTGSIEGRLELKMRGKGRWRNKEPNR